MDSEENNYKTEIFKWAKDMAINFTPGNLKTEDRLAAIANLTFRLFNVAYRVERVTPEEVKAIMANEKK